MEDYASMNLQSSPLVAHDGDELTLPNHGDDEHLHMNASAAPILFSVDNGPSSVRIATVAETSRPWRGKYLALAAVSGVLLLCIGFTSFRSYVPSAIFRPMDQGSSVELQGYNQGHDENWLTGAGSFSFSVPALNPNCGADCTSQGRIRVLSIPTGIRNLQISLNAAQNNVSLCLFDTGTGQPIVERTTGLIHDGEVLNGRVLPPNLETEYKGMDISAYTQEQTIYVTGVTSIQMILEASNRDPTEALVSVQYSYDACTIGVCGFERLINPIAGGNEGDAKERVRKEKDSKEAEAKEKTGKEKNTKMKFQAEKHLKETKAKEKTAKELARKKDKDEEQKEKQAKEKHAKEKSPEEKAKEKDDKEKKAKQTAHERDKKEMDSKADEQSAKEKRKEEVARKEREQKAKEKQTKGGSEKDEKEKDAKEKAAKERQAKNEKDEKEKIAKEKAAKSGKAADELKAKEKEHKEKDSKEKDAKEKDAKEKKAKEIKEKAIKEKAEEKESKKEKAIKEKAEEKESKKEKAIKEKAAKEKAAKEKEAKAKEKVAKEKDIPKGAYTIQQKSSKLYLDAYHRNNFSAFFNAKQKDATQTWLISPQGNGEHLVQQKSSMRYLDEKSFGRDKIVVTTEKGKKPAELWLIEKAGAEGEYTIQLKSSALFMDSPEGKGHEGGKGKEQGIGATTAVTRPEQGNDSQKYIIKKAEECDWKCRLPWLILIGICPSILCCLCYFGGCKDFLYSRPANVNRKVQRDPREMRSTA